MTIYHWHHIVPKHAGGSDDSSNLVRLTVEEHAEAHKLLFEKHGRWQDKIAWMSLSGQIGKEEARILSVKEANTGRKQNEEHIRKRMASLQEYIKKYGGPTLGKKLPPASEERKRKIGDANRGRPSKHKGVKRSESTKKKMSEAAKNRPTAKCPKCGKEQQVQSISRNHGLDGSKCFF
tara:strand:- start:84 stop:617 length:534 start_codon:yes stop_codon:yes gene_type:complete